MARNRRRNALVVGCVVLGMVVCAGAAYSPLALIVPTVEFPPLTLFTDQLIAAFENP